MPEEQRAAGKEPIVIRKYANRRLYNTATAGFVTLDDLRQMVISGEDFAVIDAQSGNDITVSILAQIVAEQETRGENLLPLTLLKQAISFYEKGMSAPFTNYLERSMSTFSEGLGRMGEIGEIGRRNFELFQKSFGAFAPGAAQARPEPSPAAEPERPAAAREEPSPPRAPAAEADLRGQVDLLKEELSNLQHRLDTLGEDRAPGRTRKRKD